MADHQPATPECQRQMQRPRGRESGGHTPDSTGAAEEGASARWEKSECPQLTVSEAARESHGSNRRARHQHRGASAHQRASGREKSNATTHDGEGRERGSERGLFTAAAAGGRAAAAQASARLVLCALLLHPTPAPARSCSAATNDSRRKVAEKRQNAQSKFIQDDLGRVTFFAVWWCCRAVCAACLLRD